MNKGKEIARKRIYHERLEILRQLEDWLETPMIVLGIIWLALFVVEVLWGISPFLEALSTGIWIVFIIDFTVKLVLAPDKTDYLKANWLTAIALLIPALRVFRVMRVFRILRLSRAARGLRLVRLLTSLNRGMKALGTYFSRRGFGYVLLLSVIVLFGGAAGMFAFENETAGGFVNYAEALWWTAMMMTTIGSDYFPRTTEGRVLCFILALYAFAVFGYITATLATFFVGRDSALRAEGKTEAAALAKLQTEVTALRAEIRDLLTERQKQI
jgi:voltage-gated potassium channel